MIQVNLVFYVSGCFERGYLITSYETAVESAPSQIVVFDFNLDLNGLLEVERKYQFLFRNSHVIERERRRGDLLREGDGRKRMLNVK